MYEYITDWAELEKLDEYPELEAIAAEVTAHEVGENEPPRCVTEQWDAEIRADAMAGVM